MRRAFLAVAVLAGAVALAAVLPRTAGSTSSAKRPCGLPAATPLWIDFGHGGSVPFWKLFARPGLVTATANFLYPPQIRQLGGSVVYIDLNFNREIGGLAKPLDPSEVSDAANELYDFTAASLQCRHPWIALNELFGARDAIPWSPNVAQYRQDVLEYLRVLARRGAHPLLLVSSAPFTAGTAGDWWRDVAKVSDLVREVYFPAPRIWKQGPYLGSRTIRNGFRRAVGDFTSIGIPASRTGIMLGFQTGVGGGREGLEPAYRWFDTVKWQALAARQVARETGLSTIWSWGWGRRRRAAHPQLDVADKARAACVYLWTRSRRLCDGPKAAGPRFNRSLTQGQIDLPAGIRCIVGKHNVRAVAIRQLSGVTGDPDVAFNAVFERSVTRGLSPVELRDVLRAERWVISTRFGGSGAGYRAALRKAHASEGVARAVLADEIIRARTEQNLRVPKPTPDAVREFYAGYEQAEARPVRTRHAVPWLGGRRGIAVQGFAPDRVFTLPQKRWTLVRTPFAAYRVEATGPAVPLGATLFSQARPAIVAALTGIERGVAYRHKVVRLQATALRRTACRHDELPQPGDVDLTAYLPFLSLNA